MDANGQRFWLALGGRAWRAEVPGSLATGEAHLCLASQTDERTYPEEADTGEDALLRVPMTADAFGTFALFDEVSKQIRGGGARQREDDEGAKRPEKIAEMPVLLAAALVTDLVLGFDGLLYIATEGKIVIHDVRGRIAETTLPPLAEFDAWRLAANPGGGVWALDRTRKKLARVIGRAWPRSPAEEMAAPPANIFLPVEENPNPPRLELVTAQWLEDGEDPVALACSAEGCLGILIWTASGAKLRLVTGQQEPGPAAVLQRVQKPFSVAWISNDRFAVLAAGVPEALVFSFLEGNVEPSGEVVPLREHDGGPLMHAVSLPVPYGCAKPSDTADALVWTRPLVSVSLPAFATLAKGTLENGFDSGASGTAWHRLYVEAEIPADTSFTIYAAASDSAETSEEITELADWHPHHFGSVAEATPPEPRAAWVPQASEIPGHKGFIGEPVARQRSGLFTVLLQRSNRRVRTLRGRFLHLRIEMRGNIRSTPELYAVRPYAPRFSYQDKYLPALYRENLFGPEADAISAGQPATPADFLGRFLGNFEGVLTRLEDSVAQSWLLTDPAKTPLEAIDWLGSWIGVAFEPWYPVERRRTHVRYAAELFRARGTLRGLRLALDIATGGGVAAGRIIVVEDFWFRRTLQTVLGVKLDRDDPLLGGPIVSGNSKVGETLFLSEEGTEKKFLALFDASIQLKSADQKVVDGFFASLAHRVTIVVHETMPPGERKLIERVAALEAPAHVVVRVRETSRDFAAGLSALLGLDSYLRLLPPPEPAEIETTALGAGPQLLRPPSLDPRLEGTSS
jgi:phage tail-like protein